MRRIAFLTLGVWIGVWVSWNLPCHAQIISGKSLDTLKELDAQIGKIKLPDSLGFDSLIIEYQAIASFLQSDSLLGESEFKKGMWAYKHHFYSEAEPFFEKSYQYFSRENLIKKLGDCRLMTGVLKYFSSDFPAAIQHYKIADSLYAEVSFAPGMLNVYNNLGNVFNHIFEYDSAAIYYLKAHKAYEKTGNEKGLRQTTLNIGTVFFNQKNWYEARKWFLQVEKLKSEGTDPRIIAGNNYNLGLCEMQLDFHNEAEKYLLKALERQKENRFHQDMVQTLNSLGNLFNKINEPTKAKLHLFQSYQMALQMNLPLEKLVAVSFLADMYKYTERWDSVLYLSRKGLSLADSIDNLVYSKDLLTSQAQAFHHLGKHDSAYEVFLEVIEVASNMIEENNATVLSQQVVKYQREKAILEKELATSKAAKLSSQRTQLWVGLMALGLILGIMVWNRQVIKKQNVHLAHEAKVNMGLVREINHRTQNNLDLQIAILKKVESLADIPEAKSVVQDTRSRIQVISKLQSLLVTPRAGRTTVALAEYLEELISGIQKAFDPENKVRMSVEVAQVEVDAGKIAQPLGLIINELLINSLKYAAPGNPDPEVNILLLLNHQEALYRFSLYFQDNGVGIPSEISKTSSGMYLIHLLSEKQLGGILSQWNDNGARYELLF